MFTKILKFDKYVFCLVLLCFFHLIGNITWLSLNKSTFGWDQAGHTIIAFKFADFFSGANRNQDFLSISDYYPPFVHLLVSFFMLIFGKNILIGPFVVTAFFILSIIFLYLYTYQLFGDKLLSLFAAFLYSFLPNIYALSREFLLEIPLITMTLISFYFLEKTSYFHHRKNTILFAVFLGLTLSVKWTAGIFFLLPIIFGIKKIWPFMAWKNLAILLGIVLLINLPWYIHNLPIILHAAKVSASPNPANPKLTFSWENFKFYFFEMANFQLTWLGMVYLIFSLPFFIRKSRHALYILSIFTFIYLVFTLIGNKDLRYVILLAPLSIIIISFYLTRFRKSLVFSLPSVLTWLISFYFLFYYFSLSFGIPINSYKTHLRESVNIPFFGWIDVINLGRDSSFYLAPTFDPTVWPNLVIAKELGNHNPQKNIKVLVVCEKPHLNQVNLELARRQIILSKIQFLAPYDIPPFSQNEDLEKYLSGYDVILAAEKDLGPEGGVRAISALKQIANYLKNGDEKFRKINSYPLPDDDKLDVYVL